MLKVVFSRNDRKDGRNDRSESLPFFHCSRFVDMSN